MPEAFAQGGKQLTPFEMSILSSLFNQVGFGEGGKALTPEELQILRQLVPSGTGGTGSFNEGGKQLTPFELRMSQGLGRLLR